MEQADTSWRFETSPDPVSCVRAGVHSACAGLTSITPLGPRKLGRINVFPKEQRKGKPGVKSQLQVRVCVGVFLPVRPVTATLSAHPGRACARVQTNPGSCPHANQSGATQLHAVRGALLRLLRCPEGGDIRGDALYALFQCGAVQKQLQERWGWEGHTRWSCGFRSALQRQPQEGGRLRS